MFCYFDLKHRLWVHGCVATIYVLAKIRKYHFSSENYHSDSHWQYIAWPRAPNILFFVIQYLSFSFQFIHLFTHSLFMSVDTITTLLIGGANCPWSSTQGLIHRY